MDGMNNHEPTNADLLEAIQDFAASVDQRFDRVESDIAVLKTDVAELKSDVAGVKSQMVTKSYLDEKLADQFSDIIQYVKRRVCCWNDTGVQKIAS